MINRRPVLGLLRRRLRQAARRGRLSRRLGAAAAIMGFLCLGAAAGEAVIDQIRQLPLAAPTAAEAAADRPAALRVWSEVKSRLALKLASDRPLEIGEVWATRQRRICGYANARASAVDDMTPFYTVGGTPRLKGEDIFTYVVVWQECLRDRWIELHVGTERTGECGSAHFRSSVLGRRLCPDKDRVWALFSQGR